MKASAIMAWVAWAGCLGCRSASLLGEAPGEAEREYVVLLHGLGRTNNSMEVLRRDLEAAGYSTCNVAYPSTEAAIETLAREHVEPAIATCIPADAAAVHFVTHSMGGLVLRQLAADGRLGRIDRVVMLGPPNQGSEIADRLADTWLVRWIQGPAGRQLGTGPDDKPKRLGPAAFELGVIAGRRSLNPFLSWMISGRDDGKVSVERTKLDGMQDFVVLPSTHTFMMRSDRVIAEVLHFLEHGRFSRPTDS